MAKIMKTEKVDKKTKKAMEFSMVALAVLAVVAIAIVAVIFAPKFFRLGILGGQSISGTEADCKEGAAKFPIYDKGNQYVLCGSCAESCIDYNNEEMCNAPKQGKCESECQWQKTSIFGGECAEAPNP